MCASVLKGASPVDETGDAGKTQTTIIKIVVVVAHEDALMNNQRKHTINFMVCGLDKSYSFFVRYMGRGEEISPQARYLLQLNHLLHTARRLNNARVVFALSSLIARHGGVA